MGKKKIQYKILPEDKERLDKVNEFRVRQKAQKALRAAEREKNKQLVEKNKDGIISNAWHMKVPKFTEADNPHGMLEKTAFASLFPQYREMYLKQIWPTVQEAFKKYRIEADLDLVEGSMTVSTTRKTWDPYSIVKARDIIKLLARSVPFETAVRVLEDDSISSDIIKIDTMVRNKVKFIKRRQRLIGPDGCTLKAIELLTKCYMLVQGSTVAAVGPFKGLTNVRRVVEDTMNNIHPVYNIKTLMIKRELAANPKMKYESWDRFLPNFKSRNVAKRKTPKAKLYKNKPYTPFPPPAPESKIDKALASGEYFLKPEQIRQRKEAALAASNEEADIQRQARREKQYERPVEPAYTATSSSAPGTAGLGVDIAQLKKKIEASKTKKGGKAK